MTWVRECDRRILFLYNILSAVKTREQPMHNAYNALFSTSPKAIGRLQGTLDNLANALCKVLRASASERTLFIKNNRLD